MGILKSLKKRALSKIIIFSPEFAQITWQMLSEHMQIWDLQVPVVDPELSK